MNALNTIRTAPALVSPAARFAVAAAVAAAVAMAWIGAEAASEEAVGAMQASLSREVNRIQLPTVVVIGQREVQVASARGNTL